MHGRNTTWGRTRSATFGAALLAALTLGAAAELGAQARPRIAVIPLDNRSGWGQQELGKTAATQLTIALVGTNAFSVLERARVESVFDEWTLGQSGAVTAESAAAIGRLLGAEYLLFGEFTHFELSERGATIDTNRLGIGRGRVGASQIRAQSAMNVRVVDVESGEIVAAAQAEGNETVGGGLSTNVIQAARRAEYNSTIAEQALGPAVEKLVRDLVSQRDRFQASVAPPAAAAIAGLGNDGTVYIDQGESSGMTVGRRFRVLRVVDEIRDREGRLLDRVTEQVGVIQVSRVLSQSSVCTILEGTAGEDDLLEPDGGI